MKLSQKQSIDRAVNFARKFFQKEGTGHDWWHTQRVKNLALTIARNEGGDPFIVEMAALLHDIGDYKFFQGNEHQGQKIIAQFLDSLSLPPQMVHRILDITANVSYMKSLSEVESYQKEYNNKDPEFMAVSDADRLDAMGAIGIARAFTYGGYYHRPIYDPSIPPNPDITREEYKTTDAPSINHFYEKLLKLKDMMVTSYGKQLAQGRHDFLEIYLERFYAEWEGKK
jgi:uncharacterized protein